MRTRSKDRRPHPGYLAAIDTDQLKAIPLFAALDDATLREVTLVVRETSAPAGTHVIREGDYAYEIMFIEEGYAEVLRGDRKVATLGPGDFFGEIAVLDKTLRTASVVATSSMRLIALSRWHLRRIGSAIDGLRAAREERVRRLAAA